MDTMKTTDTHVYFWRAEQCFSNWHRTVAQFKDPVNDGLVFHSSEQAFIWWKAVFFQDHRVAGIVEKEADPALCKKLGREVKGYDDKAWTCVRLGYMTYVCWLKFSQNPDLAKQLLDTGDRVLVEASPYDKIWGVGLGEDDPLILDKANWRGTNLLGIALMQVRKMLKDSR
jgi:ribA/ribD-fused uncharacterized protein